MTTSHLAIKLALVCLGFGLIVELEGAGLPHKLARRRHYDDEYDEGPDGYSYPPGFPDDIPVNGDRIYGSIYPGYNNDPCSMYGTAYGNQQVYYPVPGFNSLYYTCQGNIATLWACRQGYTYFQSSENCVPINRK